MAKFEIEYELRANVAAFKRGVQNVTKDASKIAHALDKSREGIEAITKEKGLNHYFTDAYKTAEKLKQVTKELNAELNKGAKASESRIRMLKQSVEAGKAQYAAQATKGATMAHPEENLTSARYALYDIANETRRVSLALVGVGAASLKVAMDFERAFVDVKRVTGETGASLSNLRQSLMDISTSSSITFTEVSRLATIGAQMGIEAQNIASFAETVAKFSAVTGVTVEEASASFGRISQLLNLSKDEYETLASAILYTGNRSVATEAEILAVTTQIAASAEQAGYATDEVIGLSTALASLKIPPEMARGVILRLFSDFDQVVAESGQQLSDFAVLLGKSREETARLWEDDPSAFFTQFTAALGSTTNSAAEMNVALNALGITETRAVATLQRFAGSPELVTKSLKDANIAMQDGEELTRQFGTVSETASEKLLKLKNSIQALMDSSAGAALMPLTIVLDGISAVLTGLTKVPAVSFFLGLTGVVAAGVGVYGLYKAAIFQASASLMAFKLAQQQLAGQGAITSLTLRSISAEFAKLTLGANFAAGAQTRLNAVMSSGTAQARLLSVAVKAIPYVGWAAAAATLIPILASGTTSIEEQTAALVKQYDAVKNVNELDMLKQGTGIIDISGSSSLFQRNAEDIKNSTAQFGLFFSIADGKMKSFNETLVQLVKEGHGEKAAKIFEEMKKQAAAVGLPLSTLNTYFKQFKEELANAPVDTGDLEDMSLAQLGAMESSQELSAVISGKLKRALQDGPAKMSAFGDATENFAEALDASKGSIDPFTDAGRGALSALNSLFNEIANYNGNDVIGSLQMTAGAIKHIEANGGDAASQVGGLVTLLNEQFGLQLDPATITSFTQLQTVIANTGGIAASTKAEIQGILDGGAFGRWLAVVQKATRKTSNEGAKTVRTLKDYASDLKGVFDRILEFKFTKSKGLITFKNTLAEIEKRAKDARRSILNLQNQVAGKTSERTDLQFELSIATQFGDTAAMSDLSRQIAVLDDEISEAQADIAYNTDLATGSLDLNTQAGRDNVTTIQDLVTTGVDYIASLAAITSDQDTLTTALEETKKATEETLRAMGLSEADIVKYTKPFTDIATAIEKVSPDVTVKFKPDDSAATRALAEFKAAAEKTKVTVTIGAVYPSFNDFLADEKRARKVAIEGEIARLKKTRNNLPGGYGNGVEWNYLNSQIVSRERALNAGTYAEGGYVSGPGTSSSDSIPARLSNGEFVMRASAVNTYGIDFMNSLNQQKGVPMSMMAASYAGGSGGGAQMVYLSPEDRKLLQDATNRPVALYTNNRVIAESANAGNVELARRGRN